MLRRLLATNNFQFEKITVGPPPYTEEFVYWIPNYAVLITDPHKYSWSTREYRKIVATLDPALVVCIDDGAKTFAFFLSLGRKYPHQILNNVYTRTYLALAREGIKTT